MKRLYSRLVRLLLVDEPSPSLKHFPTAAAMALAVVIVLGVPSIEFSNVPMTIISLTLEVAAVALAAVLTTRKQWWRFAIIVPVIDIVAIGAFRAATGGTASIFSSIIILPVVWLAVGEGRRHIVYAALGSSLALLFPFIVGVSAPQNESDLLRGVFTPIVFGLAAAIINELARQSRAQVKTNARMADDKERMLQRTVEYAAMLEESEAKYRGADRMFRGVWAAVTEQSVIGTDVTGLIDAWNPGATNLLGPTAEAAEDKIHVFDFHVPEELEERARELNYPPGATVLNPGFSALVESARLGKAESRAWHYVRTDGTRVPIQLSVTARLNETGETIGYLFVATDQTQALEVARLKDEFVGLISHELRTPLSSILGYLELLRDDDDEPLSPEQLQYLSVAERNAHRLLRLVGDLLFTAQVESGKFPLDTQAVDLAAIVSASVESAGPVAVAAGVVLGEELPTGSSTVHGDPVRLGQAVDNLISNAIKFTPRNGSVNVTLEMRDDKAVITVRDTGMGIAASELDQLFSRFFRATTATRNAVPGVGLGLTITKAIVTAHRGEMDVQSEEGVGTSFSVSIPRVRESALA